MQRSVLNEVMGEVAARRPVALVTWLADGRQELLRPGDRPAAPELAEGLAAGFRLDRSAVVQTASGEAFVNIYNPALRMVMIGAVHISQALIPMARQAGYDVIVIDPRTAFATPERFRDVRIEAVWPDEALGRLGLDARTAVVALTHDPKIDDPALRLALPSQAFYVGALGSKRTHAKRVERLTAAGLGAEAMARLHAPIGLDIGASGPVEIALSIMAEVTAVLRGKAPARRP